MKRLLLGLLLSVTTASGLYAQSFGLGGRIGFNVSTILTDDPDVQERLTFVGGGQLDAYAYKMFNKFVGIEGGIMFTQAGFGVDLNDEIIETKFTYFAVPLSARFKWGYFTLNPGFRPAILIKAEREGEDIADQVSETDLNFFVSPGIQFPVGVTLSSTFSLGLIDVFKDAEGSNTNFAFQFSVGYTFLRKGE